MMDLAPEIEKAVRDAAAREGVSVNELIGRKFAPTLPRQAGAAPVEDPIWALLREQIAEAANATPEEVAADAAGYREWQQNMDAPRRANGERLLFPDVPPLA
jgi:2-keto-4-pentenoate hydratase